MSGDGFKVFGAVVFVVAIVIGGPLAAIWALNILFHLAIPFTFKTWCAAGILEAVFYRAGQSK